MKKFILIFITSIILIITSFCTENSPKYKYIILITLDTLRQDAISPYNKNITYTPNFEKLAQDGIKFDNSYTHIPLTLPSHASILYSKLPWDLHSFFNGEPANAKSPSLQQILKKHGYKTAAFTSLGVLKKFFGLSNHFDYYQDVDTFPKRPYLFADEVNSQVFKWLKNNYNHPLFMWIHYSDPHEPYITKYSPPDLEISLNNTIIAQIQSGLKELLTFNIKLLPANNKLDLIPINQNKPLLKFYNLNKLAITNPDIKINPTPDLNSHNKLQFKNKITFSLHNPSDKIINTTLQIQLNKSQTLHEIRKNYSKEVQYLDNELGKLINKLKNYNIYSKSLIILISDHGEGLGDHKGVIGHESQLYLSQLKIPFIIIDHIHKKNIKALVTPIDVAPTILSYLKIKKNTSFDGINLLPIISSKKDPDKIRTYIKSATFYYLKNNPNRIFIQSSITNLNNHLIYHFNNDFSELYNIETDKGEKINLLKDNPSYTSFKSMKKNIDLLNKDIQDSLKQHIRQVLPMELKEQLESLGYTAH